MNIDFDKLTDEETKKIARDALAQLSNDNVIEVLRDGLHAGDLREIVEALTEDEDEDEDEDEKGEEKEKDKE
jgi:hypothetical protein